VEKNKETLTTLKRDLNKKRKRTFITSVARCMVVCLCRLLISYGLSVLKITMLPPTRGINQSTFYYATEGQNIKIHVGPKPFTTMLKLNVDYM